MTKKNVLPIVTVTLPAGLRGWFERKFQNADVFEIIQPTKVNAVDFSTHWMRTVGHVNGFPSGHPALLFNKVDKKDATVMMQASLLNGGC